MRQSSPRKSCLFRLYKVLFTHYGPQHWWPGDSPFEIMIGAILTQNTNWSNVEKALANIKAANLMDAHTLYGNRHRIMKLIRPSGFYRLKSKRLIAFLKFFMDAYEGQTDPMKTRRISDLRQELTAISGIGLETADSIILYALGKPIFVVDTYTRRIGSRHGLYDHDAPYDTIRCLFEESIPEEAPLYNEYHALLVKVGKEYCRKHEPLCDSCPVQRNFPS